MNDLDFEDRLHVSFIYQEMIDKRKYIFSLFRLQLKSGT